MENTGLTTENTIQTILDTILIEMNEWLIIYNDLLEIEYINPYAEEISGFTKDEVIHKKDTMFWNGQDANKVISNQIKQLSLEKSKFRGIVTYTSKTGSVFYLAVTFKAIFNEDKQISHYICIGKDVTDTKHLEEKLHKMSYYDETTGLPNQNTFLKRIYKNIGQESNSKFSIILMDVSQMSHINNTYGLDSGDIVLREIGGRIQKILGKEHLLTKLNGDVFGVLLMDMASKESCANWLDKVFEELNKPIKLSKGQVYVQLNVGVSFYPKDATNAGDALNKAQIALSKSKESLNNNKYSFYTETIQKEVQGRMLLENDMHKAVDNQEFIVYYQPFIDLQTKEVVGLEALIRRRQEDGKIIGPGQFMELLEQMKLIDQVGLFVVEEVCKQIQQWRQKKHTIVPVAINLSSAQFKDPCLARNIKDILDKYQIETKWISLEITETVAMEDVEIVQNTLQEFKDYGFSISIDDFGTGYSSFSYLKRFIFNHLKIDISFVREITRNLSDRVIVEAIISMAKSLGLATIAEGIETQEQLDIIEQMGCQMGQGYLWDRPMEGIKLEDKYFM